MSGISLMTLGPFVSGGAIAGAWDLANAYFNPGDLRYFPDGVSDSGPTGSTNYSNIGATAQRPVGGTFIDPTGNYLYYTSSGYYTGTAGTYQKALGTPWDITTTTTTALSSINQGFNRGIWFNSTGTWMLLTNYNRLYSYELGTAWDLSSINTANVKSSSSLTSHGRAVWNNDGTKVYRCYVFLVNGTNVVAIETRNLATAYDLSTATLDNTFYATSAPATAPADNFVGPTIDFYFNPEGTLLTVCGDDVAVYSLVTPFDLSGSVSLVTTFATTTLGEGRHFVEGGTTNLNYLYANTSGNASTSTVLYALTTGWIPPIYTNYLTGVSFKPDGTKVYVAQSTLDDVVTYNLATAWDLSTASSASEAITTGLTNPKAMVFNSTGTEFFVLCDNQFVFKSTLSTPWDLSSASTPTSVFNSVTTIGNAIEGFFVSPDGTKAFFLTEFSSPTLAYRVDLATAWDFSSASLNANTLNYGTQGNTGGQVWFKSDGTEIYILTRSNGYIHQYNLSTPWDLSSATFYTTFDATKYVGQLDASTYPSFFIDPTGSRLFALQATGIFPFAIKER